MNIPFKFKETSESLEFQSKSDNKWKSKSLNSSNVETYDIDCPVYTTPSTTPPCTTPSDKSIQLLRKEVFQQEPFHLPEVRVSKINEQMFSLSLHNKVNLLYMADKEQRLKMKTKRTFAMACHTFQKSVEFVVGNNTNWLFVGFRDQIVILEAYRSEQRYRLREVYSEAVDDLKRIVAIGTELLAISSSRVIEYEIQGSKCCLTGSRPIVFSTRADEDLFKKLKPISLLRSRDASLYCFSSLTETRIDQKQKNSHQKLSESLHVIQFTGDTQLSAKMYVVDHVFEVGLFVRSKVYQVQDQVFLMSLHEEVILIKANFKRFIVWDNVSVVASKSQAKKGQLTLADKKILVYSEGSEIFAHEIYFDKQKLQMPAIDSFKGNEDENEVLFDALLLEYERDCLMTVLLYVAPNQPRESLAVSVICINQSDPKEKLIQMLEKGKTKEKTSAEIDAFCARFNISVLERTKCMWSVCDKKLKDIENILLEISDHEYIQTELDNILKHQPHSLNFLISVETRQITRLRKSLVAKLIAHDGEEQDHQQVNRIIQWLMESTMFEKKLNYSKNFLAFKEYDFIEMSKLKAASLKEEIKLLSCKKYEKRLKYFLNSFKVLAIANFEDVFSFLLQNKNQEEIMEFILDFQFILPNFKENSVVFQTRYKLKSDIKTKKVQTAQRRVGFSPRKDEELNVKDQQEQTCILWDQLDDSMITETMEYFFDTISADISTATKVEPTVEKAKAWLARILQRFEKRAWFKAAAFKQHAMVTKTGVQLKESFAYLKQEGVFKIFVKLLYIKIEQGKLIEKNVTNLLDNFVTHKLIPMSFKCNIEARLLIYRKVLSECYQDSKDLPYLPNYIVLQEEDYLRYLLRAARGNILTAVKGVYDDIEPGFFRQRLQIYLQSGLVTPPEVIELMEELKVNDEQEIRADAFNALKRTLKLTDYDNSRSFIAKNINHLQTQEVFLPLAFQFYELFWVFSLDETYEGLFNNESLIPSLIEKFVARDYTVKDKQPSLESARQFSCSIHFQPLSGIDPIPDVQIYENTLQFFGILLHLRSVLNLTILSQTIYEGIIEGYLKNQRYKPLELFIQQLEEYHLTHGATYSKNQLSIAQFKRDHLSLEIFITELFEWINFNYNQIIANTSNGVIANKSNGVMANTGNGVAASIEKSLHNVFITTQLMSHFLGPATEVKKSIAFYELLLQLRQHTPQWISRIEYIQSKIATATPFSFIMELLNDVGLSSFAVGTPDNNAKVQAFFHIFAAFSYAVTLEKIDYQSVQFKRAIVEMVFLSIKEEDFPLASYLLLERITDDKFYFKDALLLFLSRCHRGEQKSSGFREDINRLILTPETTSLIRKNLLCIMEKYSISSFQAKGNPMSQDMRSLQIFKLVFSRRRYDDAYFFAVRAHLPVIEIMNISEHYEVEDEKWAYLLLVAYLKCLESFLVKQFYPTFAFFQSKWSKLTQPKERKDVIKDINIALSKLDRMGRGKDSLGKDSLGKDSLGKESLGKDSLGKDSMGKDSMGKDSLGKETGRNAENRLIQARDELNEAYEEFMKAIGQDPDIDLLDDHISYERKVENYAQKRSGDEERNAKEALLKNVDEISKVQEDTRLNVLNKQVTSHISEIKKITEKPLPPEQPKDTSGQILAQIRDKIDKIKQKETHQLSKIQRSAGDTSKRVADLLSSLRANKERMQRQTAEVMRNQTQRKNKQREDGGEMRQSTINRNSMVNQQPPQQSSSSRMDALLNPPVLLVDAPQSRLSKLEQLQIILRPRHESIEPISMKKQSTLEQMGQLYKQTESQEAYNCFLKYDLLKNPQARMELLKRIYALTANLSTFSAYCSFLLEDDPTWANALQMKSITVLNQMLRMNDKSQLDLKLIIPPELFITLANTSLRDYYPCVFELIKPRLRKIFENETMAVHSVGILLRYSLGNENKYYASVFAEYIRSLVKRYDERDEKLTVTVENIRYNYGNLPEPKEETLRNILEGMGNQKKKASLIQAVELAFSKAI